MEYGHTRSFAHAFINVHVCCHVNNNRTYLQTIPKKAERCWNWKTLTISNGFSGCRKTTESRCYKKKKDHVPLLRFKEKRGARNGHIQTDVTHHGKCMRKTKTKISLSPDHTLFSPKLTTTFSLFLSLPLSLYSQSLSLPFSPRLPQNEGQVLSYSLNKALQQVPFNFPLFILFPLYSLIVKESLCQQSSFFFHLHGITCPIPRTHVGHGHCRGVCHMGLGVEMGSQSKGL